ncbi:unnamed protein product [Echinostoma caproni]|uniref:CARD domain-containing protein n=1 Tax=Echinostoma caproni TaxID=27848 RepID=A0A183A2K4_9TREM|nr:unnamed protein product [Echinostoma caproni]
MESSEAYTLRICGPKIIQNLNVADVLDDLFAGGWLTSEECELINAERTSSDKTRKLLDYLRRMPTEGIKCFLEALEENKGWLADYIRSRQREQGAEQRYVPRLRFLLRNFLISMGLFLQADDL